MATVTGLVATRMLAIEAASVVSGAINGSGHLILTTHGGSTIDAGYILGSVPDASETVKGIVELATSAETTALTDAVRAITPASIASLIAGINSTTSGQATSISTLNTTVGGHTTTLASHDSSISSLNSTTASHTSTLSNYGSRIGTLEGYVNDTGWVNLGGYVSGYTAAAEPVQYRYKNNVMYIRGTVTGTYSAGIYQQVINDGNIPVAWRPNLTQRGGAVGTGMRPGGFEITVAGGIKLGSTGLSSQPGWLAFSTSYPL